MATTTAVDRPAPQSWPRVLFS